MTKKIKKISKGVCVITMRPSWKLPYIDPFFFRNDCKKKIRIVTKIRGSLVPLKFSGKKLVLYNGCWHKKAPTITRVSINFKLGELMPSRMSIKYTHLKKLKKKGSKKKK
jgi:ribosomal protein S19